MYWQGYWLKKSDDGVIRQTILKTKHYEGVYPISNFRFLKCQPKYNDMVDHQIFPNVLYRPEKQMDGENVNEIGLDSSIEFHPINLMSFTFNYELNSLYHYYNYILVLSCSIIGKFIKSYLNLHLKYCTYFVYKESFSTI